MTSNPVTPKGRSLVTIQRNRVTQVGKLWVTFFAKDLHGRINITASAPNNSPQDALQQNDVVTDEKSGRRWRVLSVTKSRDGRFATLYRARLEEIAP